MIINRISSTQNHLKANKALKNNNVQFGGLIQDIPGRAPRLLEGRQAEDFFVSVSRLIPVALQIQGPKMALTYPSRRSIWCNHLLLDSAPSAQVPFRFRQMPPNRLLKDERLLLEGPAESLPTIPIVDFVSEIRIDNNGGPNPEGTNEFLERLMNFRKSLPMGSEKVQRLADKFKQNDWYMRLESCIDGSDYFLTEHGAPQYAHKLEFFLDDQSGTYVWIHKPPAGTRMQVNDDRTPAAARTYNASNMLAEDYKYLLFVTQTWIAKETARHKYEGHKFG